MSPRGKHGLQDVDADSMLGTCNECGRIRIYLKGYKGEIRQYECSVANQSRKRNPRPHRKKKARPGAKKLLPHGESRDRKARFLATYFVNETVLSKYSISLEFYADMFSRQGGACLLCGVTFSATKKPQVDHNHSCCPIRATSCGQCIRGLLCNQCNIGLGAVEKLKNTIGMDRVLAYLG